MSYSEIKKGEMQRAESFIRRCENSDDKYYRYKHRSRPITDFRHMMETSAELYGDNVAFRQRFAKGEPFRDITFEEMLCDINGLGTSMAALGLLGEKVAVIGENCYQWCTCYLAVTMGGGVIVPLDKELDEAELRHLVIESGVRGIMFTEKYSDMFARMRADLNTQLDVLVNLNGTEHTADAYSWELLVEEGKNLIEGGHREFLDAEVIGDSLGIMLFTSGTTGTSKAVMLSQSNICYDIMAAPYLINVYEDDIFFMVLPLHHTYACTASFLVTLYLGASCAVCEGLKYIQKNLQEVRPTFLLGVPIIFESLYKTIMKNVKKQGKEKAVAKVMKLNKATSKIGINVSKRLLKEIVSVFGGRMRVMISGGAAIDPEVLDFFNNLGFTAFQGYGLTETSPLVSINPDIHRLMRNSSVGYPLPGVETKIVDADQDGIGEICFRGPNVMLGYYNNQEETDKVLKDDWFYTGDLGYIDEDGFIYITGRKKNVIITGNGKNVFPEELEYYLGKVPYISECFVWADTDDEGQDSVIVATVKPDIEEIAAVIGKKAEKPAEIEKLIWKEVDRINSKLPSFKRIVHVQLRFEEFEKTTAHKIKRFVKANKKK